MPFCPFYCPYMNNLDNEEDAFRSPNGFQPPPFPGGPGGPGYGPGGPGHGPGGPGHGPQEGPPSGPPPNKTPALKSTGPGVKAVEPATIRPCRFQYVYIWPTYGRPFWSWLTYVGPRSIAGYRWNGYGWRYFGMDLKQIQSFECF